MRQFCGILRLHAVGPFVFCVHVRHRSMSFGLPFVRWWYTGPAHGAYLVGMMVGYIICPPPGFYVI